MVAKDSIANQIFSAHIQSWHPWICCVLSYPYVLLADLTSHPFPSLVAKEKKGLVFMQGWLCIFAAALPRIWVIVLLYLKLIVRILSPSSSVPITFLEWQNASPELGTKLRLYDLVYYGGARCRCLLGNQKFELKPFTEIFILNHCLCLWWLALFLPLRQEGFLLSFFLVGRIS